MNTSHHRIAEVERYIHELAIALSGLPVEDREDVIAGIREHIDDALLAIHDPSPADVRRVLDGLGDPLAIAADAGASTAAQPRVEQPDPTQPSPGPDLHSPAKRATTDIPLLQHAWIPAATVLSLAAAALLAWAAGPGVFPLATVLWVAALVVLIASPLWSGFEKLVGVVAFGAAPVLGVAALSVMTGFTGRGWLAPIEPLGGWVRTWPGDVHFGTWFANVSPFGRASILALAIFAFLIVAVVGGWLWRRGTSRVSR